MAFLKHSVNGMVANVIELAEAVSIGRGADCDIVLQDPTVSQLHARIRFEGDQWFVTDCGSTNGILVDGKSCEGAKLVNGVSFTLGAQEFEFSETLPLTLDKTLRIKKSWIPGIYYTE